MRAHPRLFFLLVPAFFFSFAFPAYASRRVTIAWEKVPGATSYELEVAEQKGRALSETVAASQTSWKGRLPAGQYTYRIRALGGNPKTGPWTEPKELRILNSPYHTSVGIGTGLDYSFPLLHSDYLLLPRLSVGVLVLYVSNVELYTRFRTFGGFLTASYFFSDAAYYGLFLQTALGVYYTTEPAYSQSALAPAIQALVSWRKELLYGVDLRLGAGGQFVGSPRKDPSRWVVAYSGLLPLFVADIGFNF